jgi:hypothetical protein
VSASRPPLAAALAVFATFAAPVAARAQESTAADTGVVYFMRGPGALARFHLVPWLDLRLRHDAVHDRPGAPDFDRQRATLRAGLAYEPPAQPLRIELGLRASLGSDRNRETWSPFDNEVADTVEFDRAGVRAASASGDVIAIGKMRLPVTLTELVWDDDLRPVGIGVTSRLAWTGIDGLALGGGAFTRAQFESDDARVVAAQLGLARGNPARAGGAVRVSYLGFGNTDALVEQVRARQNRVVAAPGGPRLAEDFDVLDVQAEGHAHPGGVPVTARVDAAINASAENDRRAVRTRLAAGGASAPLGIEVGWIYQRIEREALPGAFNSDDWWFHTRAQGHSAFVHAGLGRPVTLRIAGFVEKRDDVAEATRRLLVELRSRWGD